jgi:hypothetical protein
LQRPFGAAADLGRGDILGYEEAAGPLGSGGFFSLRGLSRVARQSHVLGLFRPCPNPLKIIGANDEIHCLPGWRVVSFLEKRGRNVD